MYERLLVGAAAVLVGLPLAFACARFLKSMLYQVSDFDPVSFCARRMRNRAGGKHHWIFTRSPGLESRSHGGPAL